jgi:tRNA pseudouridine55 synthase
MKNGIIAVHKPEGMSSAHLVSCLKKILGIKKIGHTGTLDPFATGLMICGVNKGTRLSRFFLDGEKRYTARLYLGVETDTQDLTGKVIRENRAGVLDIDPQTIIQVVESFKGKQQQVPPIFSALKHNGKPLYEYARRGTPVIKPARDIEILDIRVADIHLPEVDIEVFCTSGTYIRTLGNDIGNKLGCGAHLTALCRTQTCGFSLDDAIDLDQLMSMDTDSARDLMIPMAEAVGHLSAITADAVMEEEIRTGRKIPVSDVLQNNNPDSDCIRVLNDQNELIAIVTPDKSRSFYNYSCVLIS